MSRLSAATKEQHFLHVTFGDKDSPAVVWLVHCAIGWLSSMESCCYYVRVRLRRTDSLSPGASERSEDGDELYSSHTGLWCIRLKHTRDRGPGFQ